jgi:hypothetical protein
VGLRGWWWCTERARQGRGNWASPLKTERQGSVLANDGRQCPYSGIGNLIGGEGCGVEKVVVVYRARTLGEGELPPPLENRVTEHGFGERWAAGPVFGYEIPR